LSQSEGNKKNPNKFHNILFIGIFSLTPVAHLYLPHNFLLDNWLIIFLPLFFIAAIPYVREAKKFAILVLISIIFSILIFKLIVGNPYGYSIFLILIFVYLKLLIIPSAVGFFLARFYHDFILKHLSNKKQYLINIGLTLSIGIFLTTFYSYQTSNTSKLVGEVDKRLELAKRIAIFYEKYRIHDLDTKKVIESGLIEGLYIPKNNNLHHGYDGNIIISSDKTGISLIYNDIPGGEICHWFYYMNSPNGFDTYVDDKSTKTDSNVIAINKKDKELCRSGQKLVNVRYTSTYKELLNAAASIRHLQSLDYGSKKQ